MSDFCDALCFAAECGALCACCCIESSRPVYTNPEPVVIQRVQPVMVVVSPANQGQSIAGHYVQSPSGQIRFEPINPQGPYVVANSPAPYAVAEPAKPMLSSV
ncbi:Aste57867_24831 [Aphanomyces stellatus]|uniref:Aste57867_24831 protein n=1 Tax=Aphanomyces stellatus TaxID=120398 RepID=A0A485LRJ1_9STRA|nr:hypothetical protein As57867_024753 [Aphanomyces stellatus]VFU01466.1 Aste57867_24831 [Aphanomyces stellatus]